MRKYESYDGTEEHPIQFPFVVYAEAVTKLEDNIYAFEKEHPELSLNKYSAILEEQGVKWDMRSMSSADLYDFCSAAFFFSIA